MQPMLFLIGQLCSMSSRVHESKPMGIDKQK